MPKWQANFNVKFPLLESDLVALCTSNILFCKRAWMSWAISWSVLIRNQLRVSMPLSMRRWWFCYQVWIISVHCSEDSYPSGDTKGQCHLAGMQKSQALSGHQWVITSYVTSVCIMEKLHQRDRYQAVTIHSGCRMLSCHSFRRSNFLFSLPRAFGFLS